MGGFSGLNRGATGSVKKLGSTGYNSVQTSNFSPEQMGLFKQLFGNLGPDSQLSKLAGGDQSQFDQLEAPALRQFSGLQGGLASRFSGMGSMGARNSSGFKNSINQASQDFASQLQSQRMSLQQNALRDLMGMSNSLLGQRPYEQFLVPQQKPFWQELASAGAQGLGQAAGTLPFLL